MKQINIYIATLEMTGTTYENGTPCEWQWSESSLEEYGHEWEGNVRGYVENLLEDDELEIAPDAYTIHNEPAGAIVLRNAASGSPAMMFWAAEELAA